MPTHPIFSSDRTTGFVEGTINVREETEPGLFSTFKKMVILETISDPKILNSDKVEYWKALYKIGNPQWLKYAPRNSVIVKEVKENSPAIIAFPFFPSHLALPCKTGECVWTMSENLAAQQTSIVYWFCKVTEFNAVDDVNHTHAPRGRTVSKGNGIITLSNNDSKSDTWYELRNGVATSSEKYGRGTNPASYYIEGEENIFEQLVTSTDAAKITQYEAVPRFKKRPGDLVLEGSNNTLIVLGTDRNGPLAEYTPDTATEILSPSHPENDFHSGSAGSIDIVVGRGQTAETFGAHISTTSIFNASKNEKGQEIKKEIEKAPDKTVPNEGDPNFFNDRSRILVSQKTTADVNFGLSVYNREAISNPPVEDDPNGDAAIVIKSDKIRLIARSDLQLVVKSFENVDSINGNKNSDGTEQKIKKESIDEDKWASITVRTNGDIIFTPSKNGYIKLGSDNAKKALLCTDLDATATDGTVTAAPLFTTGNDIVGTNAAGQGTFAKKILVD